MISGRKRLLAFLLGMFYLFSASVMMGGCTPRKPGSGETILPTASPTPTEAVEAAKVAETAVEQGEPLLYSESGDEKENIKVPYEPMGYKASVPLYQVQEDLSNIENMDQYGVFTDAQKQMLAKNGFVVTPSKEEQLFYIYEQNEYLKVPSFVTADSVLQVYHVFYNYSLRTLEGNKLVHELDALTDSMLKKSIGLYGRLRNKELKALQQKNIAYFGVAKLALGGSLPGDIPDEAKALTEKEYKMVSEQGSYQQSVIFPYELDYSQYKPRGHYTRSEELERYFKAMMWYGQVPFPLYQSKAVRNEDQTLQALLITYCLLLEDGKDLTRWKNIYEPTAFYVGKTDDLSILHYKELLYKVYGEKPDINSLNEKGKLDLFYEEAGKLPEPAIRPKYTTVSTPAGLQFRFMGQRYIADSEILQELVEPIKRPVPKGLDVMGILGSERACDLLLKVYEEDKPWEGYKPAFEKLRQKFGSFKDSWWQSNMYSGWLWTLKGLLKKYGEGYPAFMQTEAWQDKALNTALGSWSELRHDTVLYGKGCAAECGGGEEEPPRLKSYVEPNVEVYEKLLWLTRYSKVNLKSRGILEGELESKMVRFEELLAFLINCSAKELRNEPLSEDEGLQLLYFGGWLESLTDSFIDSGLRLRQLESETDRNMAVIADIHTVVGAGYLEVGVGPAYQIFVVVPAGGKLYLTRGAVFSYYEFMSGERLTDEQWQNMLKEGRQPGQPDWMKRFKDNDFKDEVPVPAEPYSSGC